MVARLPVRTALVLMLIIVAGCSSGLDQSEQPTPAAEETQRPPGALEQALLEENNGSEGGESAEPDEAIEGPGASDDFNAPEDSDSSPEAPGQEGAEPPEPAAPGEDNALEPIGAQPPDESQGPNPISMTDLMVLTEKAIKDIEADTEREALVVDCRGQFGYTTIQDAINDATADHVIVILPSDVCFGGAYFEQLEINNQNLFIQSIFPGNPDIVAATVIDGLGAGPVITMTATNPTPGGGGAVAGDIRAGQDTPASSAITAGMIQGLTIQNGQTGVLLTESSPVINNCVIHNNASSGSGGGILCQKSSSPLISRSRIFANSAVNGAGFACVDQSHATVFNSVITQNYASVAGGAVYAQQSSPLLRNCTLTRNRAGTFGGAVAFVDSSDALINSTLIWQNDTKLGTSLAVDGTMSIITIEYSSIEEGEEGIFSFEDSAIIEWGEGNIADDPLLMDDGVHIEEASPLINAGDPTINPDFPIDILDFLDDSRLSLDNPSDIGADEVD